MENLNILKTIVYKEKRSDFIGYLIGIKNKGEESSVLKTLQEKHEGAKHILKATRIKNEYGVYIAESSDDREPVGSMKKVRAILEKNDVRDIGIYIVRYFGGTKLGASNLDHIYTSIAFSLINEDK